MLEVFRALVIASTMFSVPMTYSDNRPFIDVRVNGIPLRFVVDTGGYDGIDLSAAKRLGLHLRSAGTVGGAGEGRLQLQKARVATLQVGSRTLRNQDLEVIDFSIIARKVGISKFDGVIGYDFFAHDAVLFENSQSRLVVGGTLNEPRVPFSLYGTIPLITASVDGVSGRFILDTGDRSNLTVFPNFAAANSGKFTTDGREVLTGWGIGGAIYSQLFRASDVSLGDLSLANVVGRIPNAKRGAFAASDISGSIGNGFMRHFDVLFDYANRTLALKRNPNPVPVACNQASMGSGVIAPQECMMPSTPAAVVNDRWPAARERLSRCDHG